MNEYQINYKSEIISIFANNEFEAGLKFCKANNLKPSYISELKIQKV